MNTATATTTHTTWNLDPSHSELLFKVKHLMISSVKGEFRKLTASIDMVGDDLGSAKAKVNIDAASVFTNDDNRDNHLRSADFFDAGTYPEITFESTSFLGNTSDCKLTGNLTMKGVTKPVTLNVEFGGTTKDPWGNERMGFSLTGIIHRKDWGLSWNAALETGGVMVSDEVRISAEVQFVKQ